MKIIKTITNIAFVVFDIAIATTISIPLMIYLTIKDTLSDICDLLKPYTEEKRNLKQKIKDSITIYIIKELFYHNLTEEEE